MSTQGELLRQLFRGYKKRYDVLLKRAAEEIIKDEKAKNHRLLADDLEKILLNGSNGIYYDSSRVNEKAYEIPKDRERGFPLIEIIEYNYTWDRIILLPKTIDLMQRICNENFKRDILATSGYFSKAEVVVFWYLRLRKT